MKLVEPFEYEEIVIDGTTFVYERLAASEYHQLANEFQERGVLLVHDWHLAAVTLQLRAWRDLTGRGGREVSSPARDEQSAEATTMRRYVAECLPYNALAPLAEAILNPSPEALVKNLSAPLNGATASPAEKPDGNLPAGIAEPPEPRTPLASLATVAA